MAVFSKTCQSGEREGGGFLPGLKAGVPAAEFGWIDGLLSRWPKEIDGIESHHWGFDVSGRGRGYQWGLVMRFSSEEAEAHYHPHPLHQEFAQWVIRQGGEVLAFDFPLSDGP